MSNARLKASLRKVSKPNVDLLSGQEIILCISVGQSYHYGNHLLLTYKLLDIINLELQAKNKPGIKKLTVSINGELQRHSFWYFAAPANNNHTFIPTLSDDELREALKALPQSIRDEKELAEALALCFQPYALKAENDYLEQHQQLLFGKKAYRLQLSLGYIHKRTWGEWLKDSRYKNLNEKLVTAYQNNSSVHYEGSHHTFQAAFDESIQDLLNDSKQHKIKEAANRIIGICPSLATFDFQKVAYYACLHYLLEECPILAPMWSDSHVLYPHAVNSAFKASAAACNAVMNWHHINFSDKPQQEENKLFASIDNTDKKVQWEDEESKESDRPKSTAHIAKQLKRVASAPDVLKAKGSASEKPEVSPRPSRPLYVFKRKSSANQTPEACPESKPQQAATPAEDPMLEIYNAFRKFVKERYSETERANMSQTVKDKPPEELKDSLRLALTPSPFRYKN